MNLDGDKLLAELSRIEGLRLKQLDMDIENCQYESISNRWIEIGLIRKVIKKIETGDYTI